MSFEPALDARPILQVADLPVVSLFHVDSPWGDDGQ